MCFFFFFYFDKYKYKISSGEIIQFGQITSVSNVEFDGYKCNSFFKFEENQKNYLTHKNVS